MLRRRRFGRGTVKVQNFKRRFGQETVKVQNLNKKTSAVDILRHLFPITNLDDISVKQCEDHPVNYAYVNCYRPKDAQDVIRKLNDITLHGNKLTAKLKEDSKVKQQQQQLHTLNNYSFPFFRKSPSPVHSRMSPTYTRMSRSRSNSSDSSDDISAPSAKKRRTEDYTESSSTSDNRERKKPRNPTSSNSSSASTNRTIKVSMTDIVGINTSDIDEYFRVFGPITSPIIIRSGQPHYAYINFESETAVKGACGVPHHTICGKLVTVKPKSFSAAPAAASTPGLTPVKLTCNHLVIEKAKNDMTEHFREFKLIQISSLDDEHIVIYAPEAFIPQTKRVFTKIIQENEANIATQQIYLSFYHYPLLESQNVHDQLHKAENKFELKIERCGSKISLTKFQEDWKNIEKEITPAPHRDTRNSSTEDFVQWYWHNDDTFVAYDSKVNTLIESAAQASTPSVQVSSGSHNYVIDILNRTQTNSATKKVRDIERRLIHSKKYPTLKLHLTCHKDHVLQLKSHIVGVLDRNITEQSITLSDSVQELGDFVEQLIDLCSKTIVEAVWDKGRKELCLKGAGHRVCTAKQDIQVKIIAKERELGKISSTQPLSWTPQSANCELKPVLRGSDEWKSVEKKFMQKSHMHIVEIERIQNKWLWENYSHAKDRMLKKNVKTSDHEKHLFHGTRSTPPKVIYNSEQGFDHRMASKGLYGEGAYFAVESSYSAGYAHTLLNGHKQMFLVKVLTGVPYESKGQDNSLKAPPIKPQHESRTHGFEGERYDSVTAFTGGSQIYVIYEQGRAYPEYLITYKDQNSYIC